ncbi:MAG: magnesium/cobalt transporter CorA [Elusimicrobiota bacterium]|nr:MAG: magnesium/cobalt transporter CorA [Elusimicrobiota bacterium]
MAKERQLKLQTRFGKRKPGTSPGVLPGQVGAVKSPEPATSVKVTVIDWSADQVEMHGVLDFDAFIASHRPAWSTVRWINVDGLTDPRAIDALAKKYELHPLAVEDLLNTATRPKADAYGGDPDVRSRLFVITRMIELKETRLESEQISIFLGHKTVLTFQESPGDVWDPIRQRINSKGSRLRQGDASFLVYTLMDAIVDHIFPVLEAYGDRLEDLETRVVAGRDRRVLLDIHALKRELLLLRRALWPMRDVVHQLQGERHECLSENTRTYMTDLYDHVVQAMDILETYREVVAGLSETHLSAVNNRLNEVMKVLTIISVVFIPMNFMAGVFGMNFEVFPWKWPHAFPAFVIACLTLSGSMLFWFRRRGWL